jgi:spore maturation protein CgeB
LVISDKEEQHGPEVQAFLPGKTGLSYRFGDLKELYQAIDYLLKSPDKRKEFGSFGSSYVREIMGSEIMLTAFLDAIFYAARKKRSPV